MLGSFLLVGALARTRHLLAEPEWKDFVSPIGSVLNRISPGILDMVTVGRLPQASLHAVVAGARRRVDPRCPRVQVARGGQMEPLKGSWRAPPAQLAAAARPQARPRLLVPGMRLGWLVGPCSDRCAGLCAYSPCGVCVRLMSRSSSLVGVLCV